jgi:catechol 2,3-dioxygenase-like lactoylglutathione lyase family enzyme
MATETRTRMTDVRTVGVPVSDQERALAFYEGTLGFERRIDAEFGEGLRWIEVAPRGASTSIALVPADDANTPGVDTGVRLATSDTGADHAHLRAAGADADEILLWEGVPPMFSFRDPDGNTLYVVEAP